MLKEAALRLHSYVVARDYGFAPNPFYGFCTLATCKPKIRGTAQVGDWVLGTGSAAHGRAGFVTYAMRITEAMSFEDYWNDPRFQVKKPVMQGSIKQAFGDNIYRKDKKSGLWRQLDSHHSLKDGSPNEKNISNDTQVDRVLISNDFVYWGACGPRIPRRFRSFNGFDICGGRGHKNKFPREMIDLFVDWLRSTNDVGYCGDPHRWGQ